MARILSSPPVNSEARLQRQKHLIRAGVAICVLGCVFLSLNYILFEQEPHNALITLALTLPFLATLLVLKLTDSCTWAGNYLLVLVVSALSIDLTPDHGFSLVAMITIPIIASHILGPRAGIVWTLVSMYLVYISGDSLIGHGLDLDAFIVAITIVVALVGIASALIEASLFDAYSQSATSSTQLEHQRETLLDLLDKMFPTILEVHTDSDPITFNPSRSDFLRKRRSRLSNLEKLIHQEDLTQILSGFENGSPFHAEVRIRSNNDHWGWVELYAIADTQPNTWFVAMRNITDELIERKRKEQEDRLQGVGLLAAGIAHDFNNLLTVILGFGQLLPEGDAKSNIVESAKRASDLTSNLLLLGGDTNDRSKEQELNHLLSTWNDIFQSILGEGIEFRQNLSVVQCWIEMNEAQIQQIMVNLLKNAKEAMPNGGSCEVSSEIKHLERYEFAQELAGWYAVVSVSDNGMGMDTTTKEHIFDPYYSTKGESSSRGLGMASVYSILRKNGGGFKIDSSAGRGTKIEIALPITTKPEENTDSVPPPANAETASGEILVVEDEPKNRELLKNILNHAGYEVHTADDGAMGLEVYDAITVKPELVISDVVMPVMKGSDLAKRIWEREPAQKILFVSGYASNELGDIDFDDQRVFFLSKPYDLDTLMNLVQEISA